MQKSIKNTPRLLVRTAKSFAVVLFLIHSTLTPLALAQDAPTTTVGGQDSQAYIDQQQGKLDDAKTGSSGGSTSRSIEDLKQEYTKECETDLKRAENKSGSAANASGELDSAALGQKVLLCGLVKSALETAEVERVEQIAWTVVSVICAVACTVGKTPYGAWSVPACSLGNTAAGIATAAADMVLSKNVNGAIMNAVGSVASAESIGGNLKSLGSAKKDFLESKPKAGTDTKKGGKEKKGDSESCKTLVTALLEMAMHIIKKGAAKQVAADTLAGIHKLKSSGGGGPQSLALSMAKSDLNAAEGLGTSNVKPNDPTKAAAEGNSDSGLSGACAGGTGNAALTMSCARSMDKGLASFDNKALTDLMDKRGGPGFFDRDPLTDGQIAQDMQTLSGMPMDFAPMIEAAKEMAGAGGLAQSAAPASTNSEVKYSQNTGGERAPASDDKSLEDMMASLMGGMDKDKGPEKPGFEKDLEFRYSKDPAALGDDPRVSIFRRVSFRYKAVDKRTGFAAVVPAPPPGSGQ